MRFLVKARYDRESMTELHWARRVTVSRRKNRIAHAVIWGLIALGILELLLILLLDTWEFNSRTLQNCLMASVLFLLLNNIDALNGWVAARELPAGMRETQTLFEENGYTIQTKTAKINMSYADIIAACESQEHFFLFTEERNGQFLPKSSFIEGTPDDFRKFITEKTGKPVEYIK